MVRLLIAAALASATTFGLVFLMHSLINADIKEPKEVDKLKLPDITMGETEITDQYDQKPEKPETPDEPPPDTPEPEVDSPDIQDAVNVSAPKMGNSLGGIGLGAGFSDGDFMPIYAAPPMYPSRAMSRGTEGWVVVSFTVTPQGTVQDPVVVDADPPNIFNKSAVRAVKKFKYRPRVVDGVAQAVPGVSYKFTFKLDQSKKGRYN